MRKCRAFFMGFVVLFLLTWLTGAISAQSLSDLDRKTFENLSEGLGRRVPVSPFASGVSTAEDLTIEDLILTGIARNANTSYAMISGYLVKEGDRIAGFRVDSIEKGRVALKRMDEVYVLTMGGL